jgi:hypothetical protein
MTRAFGLVLGGVSFATLAAVTIASSAPSTVAGSAAMSASRSPALTSVSSSRPHVRTLAYARAPASTFIGRVAGHQASFSNGNGPLISAQTVSGVTPNAGPSGPGGEQQVVIAGSGFTGVTDVAFGGTDVTSTSFPCLASAAGCFTVASDTEIDADTPVESSQTVDVIVTGGSATGGDQYSFVDPPTVTNVASPKPEGATGIAVTGTNFSDPTDGTNGVSQVQLNPTGSGSNVNLTTQCSSGGQASCFTFVDDADLTINLPASMTAGTYDTIVTAIGGASSTSSSDLLTVVATPTLTNLNPASGPIAGGNQVVLTGTDLTGATNVNVGALNVSSSNFTVDSATQITIPSFPAHAAGGVLVSVDTPAGTSNTQPYTYDALPTLTNLNPPAGPIAGGNQVVLTGTDFTGATNVNVGALNVSSSNFTVNSATQITIPSFPAHAAGGVLVSVDTPDGTSNTQAYTYDGLPTLTNVNPSSGPVSGGNQVVLTGTNFTGATNVNVGALNVSSSNFTVDSATQITIPSFPAHAAGGVLVSVDTPGGTSNTQSYTYEALPTLTTVNPSAGPIAGGNQVVLTGTDFTGATNVNVGALNVSSSNFTVNSATQITIPSFPAHAAGGVLVSIDTPGGTTNTQPYTYDALPTLTNLNPSAGPITARSVALTGTGFSSATQVDVAGSSVSFVINSDSSITATFPAHAAGPVSVTVTNPGGTSTPPLTYTYTAAPTLTSLSSTSGPTSGSTVNLTGTGFTTATDVNVGSHDITSFTINSNTSITANFPANAAGPVAVTVTNPGGTSTPALTYTYAGPPTLTNLNPTAGPTSGSSVTLTGTGFSAATDVNVGIHDITSFAINSDTSITASFPGNAAGPVSVTVTSPGGTSTPPLTYTYTALPTLTSLSSTSGPTSGSSVTLTGAGFTTATDVNVGSHDITSFTINSDTSITANFPANAAGPVSVTVTNPGGTSTPALTYTYIAVPTVTAVSPTAGPTSGGNTVNLSGTAFTGATDVFADSTDIGVSPCPVTPVSACFTVNSPTSITVKDFPAHGAGTIDMTVQTVGGTSAMVSADEYAYAAAPTVTNVTPNAGSPNGGNTVTITGTSFMSGTLYSATQVSVGSTHLTACGSAPCFTVNSPTSIAITGMPPGTAGTTVDITVTVLGVTSAMTSSDEYTYTAGLPTVTSVLPRNGSTNGNENVQIVGSNFENAGSPFTSDVFFNTTDVPATNHYPCPGSANGCFTVTGPNTINVFTPQHAAGLVDITVQTPIGTSGTSAADDYTFVAPGAYTALTTPFRICDTRPGSSTPLCANHTLAGLHTVNVQITGVHVPAGAQAVVVNLTAINHSSSATFVTAYPFGTTRPNASNINLPGGTNVQSNLAIVQLSTSGQITLFNSVGSADVIVDIQGYFATPPGGNAGAFHTIPPLRICDTRADKNTECATTANNPIAAGTWRHVVLSGDPPNSTAPSIPTGNNAAAAVFNLTATGGTKPTFLSVAAATGSNQCPTSAPAFSNLNPGANGTLPIRVISQLGSHQDICVFNAAGSINVIVDVSGWFSSNTGPVGAYFYSVPPTRICDTRVGSASCAKQALVTGTNDVIGVAGVTSVIPADFEPTPPVAIVANLTGVAGTAPTFFTLYPSDAAKPEASDLNPGAKQVIANLAISGISTTLSTNLGDVTLFNAVGTINAILDVAGWFQ